MYKYIKNEQNVNSFTIKYKKVQKPIDHISNCTPDETRTRKLPRERGMS